MTVAIIQARMKSTRLPRKILMPLAGEMNALQCMLARLKQSKRVDKVVFAVANTEEDTEIHRFLDTIGTPYVVGSEDDVLDRYWQAARKFAAPGDTIVRLTSDCPVIDPAIVDKVIDLFHEKKVDFASNSLEPYTFPDGTDAEVFSYENLERAATEATLPSHREHVTFYFWKNPELFKIYNVQNTSDQYGYRLTLDYPEDHQLLKRVYEHFSPRVDFTLAEIIGYLDSHPEVNKLNAHVIPRAGWQSALKKDEEIKK